MFKSLFYIICIDQRILLCSKIEDKYVLPRIEVDGDFSTMQEAKSYLVNLLHAKIKRYDFTLLIREENANVFAAIIDLNDKKNVLLIKQQYSPIIEMPIAGVFDFEWDDAGKMAIDYVSKNQNYKDAFNLIKSKGKISLYSKESKALASYIFNDTIGIWQSDRPDIIVETVKHITGIECFQIDASESNCFGSKGAVERKRMINSLDRSGPWKVSHATGSFSNSLENLFNNFKMNLNGHSKWKDYLTNLKSVRRGKRVSLGLFVEDATLLGTYYQPKTGGFTPLYLFNIKEFWDIFLSLKTPLFFLFQQTGAEHKDIIFITKHDYEFLLNSNSIFSIDDIDAMFFDKPNLIGTTYPI